jgi:hypothetical protein
MDKWLIEPTIWGACLNMGNTNEMAILVEHMMSMNNQKGIPMVKWGNLVCRKSAYMAVSEKLGLPPGNLT